MMKSVEQSVEDRACAARSRRARKLSSGMAVLCAVIAPLLVFAMAFYWFATPSSVVLANAGLDAGAMREIGYGTRSLACAVSMLPLLVLAWGLMEARRCLLAFAAGRFFSIEAVNGLWRFSLALLVSALLKPVAGAALSVILSWNNGPGARTLTLSFSSDTLLALVIAGTIAVISWVLSEAVAIAAENAQFV